MQTLECHMKQLESCYFAQPLVDLAQQCGVHADITLKGSKLFRSDLFANTTTISFEQLERIIINICAQPSCRELSFIYGQYLLNTLISHYGSLLFNCRSIQHLINVLLLRGLTIFPLFHFRKLHKEDGYHLTFSPAIAQTNATVLRFLYEVLASILCGYVKWRCPEARFNIQFPFDKPKEIAQYLSYLSQSYSFQHSDFVVAINKPTLIKQQINNFPFLVNKQLQITPKNTRGFLAQLHRLQLKYPKYHSEQIASLMGMSAATFKRKLKLHNTTFLTEKDRVHRQQAMFYVAEQGYSNEQVASALHFSDITNFRRAFKRWTGLTPSYFRKT